MHFHRNLFLILPSHVHIYILSNTSYEVLETTAGSLDSAAGHLVTLKLF